MEKYPYLLTGDSGVELFNSAWIVFTFYSYLYSITKFCSWCSKSGSYCLLQGPCLTASHFDRGAFVIGDGAWEPSRGALGLECFQRLPFLADFVFPRARRSSSVSLVRRKGSGLMSRRRWWSFWSSRGPNLEVQTMSAIAHRVLYVPTCAFTVIMLISGLRYGSNQASTFGFIGPLGIE